MRLFRLLSFLTLASCAVASRAEFLVFTDRAAFLAAAGVRLSTIDFESVGLNSYENLNYGTGGVPAGINFTSIGSLPYGIPFGATNGVTVLPAGFFGNPFLTSAAVVTKYPNTMLDISFSGPTYAFGADLLAYNFLGKTSEISVGVSNREWTNSIGYLVTPMAGTPSFFGVVATEGDGIYHVQVGSNSTGSNPGVANVVFGPTVPGPMAALPFALMALRRRKRA